MSPEELKVERENQSTQARICRTTSVKQRMLRKVSVRALVDFLRMSCLSAFYKMRSEMLEFDMVSSRAILRESFLADAKNELTIEDATDQLIFGAMDASPESAYQYGYALKYACRELSVAELVIEGKRRLAHFKVKSKLFDLVPFSNSEYDDFPEIGYRVERRGRE